MALLDSISFELDQTEAGLGDRFQNVTFGASAPTWVSGRHGGQALSAGEDRASFETLDLGDKATLVVGFAMKANNPETGNVLQFRDAGSAQVSLRVVATGSDYQLELRRDTTSLDTSPTYSADTWRYHELKITFHATTGAYELRTDGTTEFSDTNVDTTQTVNNSADTIEFGLEAQVAGSMILDDIYILDTSGSDNNDFKGDCTVEGRLPDGDGDSSQWTPLGGGANYVEVDEANESDDAASYVSTNVNGNKDLYTMQDLVILGNAVHGIVQVSRVSLDQAGSRAIKFVSKESATEANSSNVTVDSTSWSSKTVAWDTAPDGTAWDVTKANAAQFGYESVS